MQSTTVRISPQSLRTLKELAKEMNASMQSILEEAVENYRRKRFLEETNKAFAALRKDKRAWEGELKEREAWDATSSDGMEDE